MVKNEGKIFEADWLASVPDYCFIHRLRDSAQSYNNSKQTRFTWNNECDFFMFDSNAHLFYAIECKSTKYKSISYQIDKNDNSTKMIKYHQLESLDKMSKYSGIIAGLVLNFRDENNDMERTYFIDIRNFLKMKAQINKTSCNEMDLLLNGAVKISGVKKRTHYRWNIDNFLEFQQNANKENT